MVSNMYNNRTTENIGRPSFPHSISSIYQFNENADVSINSISVMKNGSPLVCLTNGDEILYFLLNPPSYSWSQIYLPGGIKHRDSVYSLNDMEVL